MDQDQMSNLYKEPSIDTSYQVSVHLAKGFQRRILKCEKLTDDGRQVMAKATVQLIGTNLGHNIPLVDHTNQYIPTIMTIFGLKVLLTDVIIIPR
jgi:hypothetical protein